MNDYSDNTSDSEAWDGQTDGIEPYDPEHDYGDEYDIDDFDCGEVEDKRLCADIGSEHCSFYCPLHAIVMARNPDDYPEPEGYEDELS
jgi:hypothetical protein